MELFKKVSRIELIKIFNYGGLDENAYNQIKSRLYISKY